MCLNGTGLRENKVTKVRICKRFKTSDALLVTCCYFRLVSDDPHGSSVQSTEPHDDVLRVPVHYLKEITFIDALKS